MNREGAIDLLNDVEDSLSLLKKNDCITPVKVKSMLEHMRSSLEYIANDIYDKECVRKDEKRPNIYFPFGKPVFVEKFFTKHLRLKSPNDSRLFDLITSLQDYHTGDNWLDMMCNLTNDAKHRKPISLEKEEITSRMISAGGVNLIQMTGNCSVLFEGNFVNGQKVQDFTYENGDFTTKGNGIAINITITKENKIRFHGHDYEVIPYIEKCLVKLKTFHTAAYELLEATP